MATIRFNHRFDKLEHPLFTTLRSWTPDKQVMYQDLEGQELEIEVEGKIIGTALLLSANLTRPEKLPAAFIAYDTRYEGGSFPLNLNCQIIIVLTLLWTKGGLSNG